MIELIYTSSSSNTYLIQLFYKVVEAEQLVFEPDYVRDLCRKGCKNFGQAGGCPPRAPLYTDLVQPENNIVIVSCKFDSIHKPLRVRESKNTALHWKFQDAVLANLLNQIGNCFVNKYGGLFLGTGYCKGCPGKKCSFKLGSPSCRNPQRRTYSMEATGINVVRSMHNLFGIPMFWYSKGKTDVPYMLKCITYVPPPDISLEEKSISVLLREVDRLSIVSQD